MVDNIMEPTKMWDYRVVRKESADGSDEWYSIQEIYYDDDGQPMAQTIDLTIEGDTITEMRTQLEKMINCLDQPVLDESDITNNEEDKWICEVCGKSTYDVEYDYIGSGTNHLGCELEIEMAEKKDDKKYIYESPDGGETIYRRKMGEDEREELKAKKSWVCSFCGKSTYYVEDDYIGSGTNHLGCELEIEMGEKTKKKNTERGL